jgi:NitT/TauT family transport system ATP-binding protein
VQLKKLLGFRLITTGFGLAIILLIWKIVSANLSVPSTLPAPEKVLRAGLEMWHSGELAQDVSASLRRILTGFSLAFAGAIIVGIASARYLKIYRNVSVFLDLLSSIPPIAWTPLAILWFGIGDAPAYFIVFLGAFFPMFVSIYSGFTRIDRNLISAARTLGATPTLVVLRVILPGALPSILTGIRTGLAVGWFNVIAAELIGVRSGLGYKIQLSRTLLSSENVIALMIVIGIIGWIMAKSVAFSGSMIAPWAIEDESRARWIARRQACRRLWKRLAQLVVSRRIPKGVETNGNLPPTQNKGFEKLLDIQNVSQSFSGQISEQPLVVLQDVSFAVRSNEVFTIIGPNGSGKTTLLKMLAGLMEPDQGTILFRGKKVENPSCERTIIFQDFALFPWLTAVGNLNFAQKASRRQSPNTKSCKGYWNESADSLLDMAALRAFGDTYPADLSGGMRQRLALVRALAVEPDLILMDEPFASFDPLVREDSQQTILSLLQQKPVTVLLVTHDLDEAIFMSDRILVMSQRPGRVKTILKVDFPRPRDPAIRRSDEFQRFRAQLWEIFRTPLNESSEMCSEYKNHKREDL